MTLIAWVVCALSTLAYAALAAMDDAAASDLGWLYAVVLVPAFLYVAAHHHRRSHR